MKQIFFIVTVILIGLTVWLDGNAQTVITGGNVSGKWTKANSPYQVNGNITVAKGAKLEIEPGVTVAFAANASLTINGQLLAQGTKNDIILFSRQSADNWRGITFSASGENESVIKYASIKYVSGRNYYGGICITGGTVTLNNNMISDNNSSSSSGNGGGVYIAGGIVILSNNTISNNIATNFGGGVYVGQFSTVNMYNNIISGNSAGVRGGGICVYNMIANIHNNVISNNKHAAVKSGYGGGISLYNSNSMIINNTIAYNDAEHGGGIYCSNGSSPVVINNILYGNTNSLQSQVFINDNNSAPKMLYNLNQCDCMGHSAGVNYNWEANYDDSNFDANPRFVNYALQNYRLQANSPCINAGIADVTGLGLPNVDVDGNVRIYGGRIDIGAYEYGAQSGIEEVSFQNQLAVYPNPSPNGIFYLATTGNEIRWSVFDMKGQQISQGNEPLVDLSSHQKGIYMIKVQTGKDIVTAKLVRL